MVAIVVRERGIMHLVLGHKMHKTTSRIFTQALRRIIDIPVTIGKVVCQMIFLVVDMDIYNLLLGFNFLMKIGAIIDVGKGILQVCNRPSIIVEVLPLNVVTCFTRFQN
jgi:hypothetical protein